MKAPPFPGRPPRYVDHRRTERRRGRRRGRVVGFVVVVITEDELEAAFDAEMQRDDGEELLAW